MMRGAHRGFEIFLRRVHRRQVLFHLLERTGLGVLGACLAGLPLVLTMLWRQESAEPLTVWALVLGAMSGFVWGMLTRPTRLAAAMQADRQLRWADLLSSVMTIESRAGQDAWAGAVLSAANARCDGVSPSAIVLNRLGARAWGGIGLATALLIVLTLMPAYSTPLRAGSDIGSSGTATGPRESDDRHEFSSSRDFTRRTADQPEPDDANSSRMGQDVSPSQNAATRSQEPEKPSSDSGRGNQSGDGRGQSRSNPANAGHLPGADEGTAAQDHANTDRTSAGVGRSSSDAAGTGNASGKVTGNAARHVPVPPWHSADWPADVARAQQALSSGQIPDAYRDLVRDYFERP